jgi:hypothetical protein
MRRSTSGAASIFAGLPKVDVHLIAYDTRAEWTASPEAPADDAAALLAAHPETAKAVMTLISA